MNNEVVDNERLGLIVGMLFVWTGLFAISCIILAVTMPNSDFESVVAVVASALGNTGPTLEIMVHPTRGLQWEHLLC